VLAGPPLVGRQLLKSFEISAIRFVRGTLLFLQQFVQVFGQDRPNGVDSVVSVETFSLNPGQRVDDYFFTEGKLVLHHDMNNCVKLRIRQFDFWRRW
jgi:hypothetical protein